MSIVVVVFSEGDQLGLGWEAALSAPPTTSRADVRAIIVGHGSSGHASEVASRAPDVLALDAPSAQGSNVIRACLPALLEEVATAGARYVLLPASNEGRDVAGYLSGRLGWGVLANAIEVHLDDGRLSADIPIIGDAWVANANHVDDQGIVTVRVDAPNRTQARFHGIIRRRDVSFDGPQPTIEVTPTESVDGPELEQARVIVAGGRGLGGESGVELLATLARSLDGVVAGSLVAVEAGWIPFRRQVGQTGRIVRPELYVAAGISGAIGHKVGMQGSNWIVAINSDPDAPILGYADLFVVGDLFEVIPELVRLLETTST